MVPQFGIAFSGQLESELRLEGVDVTVLGPARLSRPLSIIATRRALRSLVNVCQPHVVVTHGAWVHCALGSTVKEIGVPLTLFLHSPARLHLLDLRARMLGFNLVIANSRFTLARSRWWLGSSRRAVCSPPIRAPRGLDREMERRTLGIADDTTLVLQASRLDPYKGHQLLLRALSQIETRTPWCMLIAGGAQPGREAYARSLLQMRDDLGLANRVQFLGHRTDTERLMVAADIFCQPNVAPESFGIAFVEAMFAGLPIVTTRMGSAIEILAHGGGELVPPEPGPLADMLSKLIDERKKRVAIGLRGQEIALRNYGDGVGVRELASKLVALGNYATPGEVR